MTYLITGAAGFVGAALAEALIARGETVIAVDRGAAPAGTGPGRHRPVSLDLTEPGALDPIFAAEPVDTLVIGAAVTADAARERADPAGIVAVNVGAVADAVRAAGAHGVRRVLYLGSGAVYGDSAAGPEPLVEDATPLRPRSLYAITKQAGEAAALRLAETVGINCVAARLGTCFGPFERDTGVRDTLSAPLQVLRLAKAGGAARLPRPGHRDWLYIRDAVAGLLALLDAPALPHRVYNVAAGFTWSLADWCARVAARHPGFAWSVTEPAHANIRLYDAFDRAPMSIARLVAETGYRPRYDLPAAAADFLGRPGPMPR
ncbi:NAD-dependent epimerase/dehydratase family protein [Methylobacterium soli]|uniref:NAD(P)-dependent oxidoreductase n=2 Tax=Methylobacterium soli TaxID=553447 RepID=A0A6L3SVZ6_9HYPH|nr:NAD(P)-dependent oxidoreductase [Methylobacterium soli]KAB1077916.1 NAD(P)-dependent oxidoreductase [Methylobacterium soli]